MGRTNRSLSLICTILLMLVGGVGPLHTAGASPHDAFGSSLIGQDIDTEPTEPEVQDPEPTISPPPPTIPPPEPTNTPEPTLTPTETPTSTATDEPAPTEPTVEPTATATAAPTETPTATSVTPTVTPTPSLTPTPVPRTSGPGTRSIVSGSGCTQISSTDTVEVNGVVTFSCEARTGAAFVWFGGTVSAPTSGWQYRVNNTGSWLTASSNLPTQSVILGSSVPAFTVSLRPTSSVSPGTSGSVTVSVTVSCPFGCGSEITTYASTLGATRAAPTPTASDLQLVCAPATVNTGAGVAQTVSCVYSGRASLASRQVTLTRVVVPAPAGWTISGSAGTVSGTTLTVTPNTIISYSATAPLSYSFTFTVTPSCNAATTNQPVAMTSTFSYGATTGITGATATGQVARSSQSSLALSIQASSLNWNQVPSFTDTTVSGNLTYRINATGCTGWAVTVSASPYTYSGSSGGTAIPAANMTLTGTGIPLVISGSGTGVARQVVSGSMSSSRKVLTAATGTGTGIYEQRLDFSLTIPGKSRTGTYQSTITLTAVAAP